jgi:nucleoside-diphosphate-sugar epimerase
MRMRVVITGGAGFIGLKLATQLLRQGALLQEGQTREVSEIVLFDRSAAALPPALSDSRISFIAGDITDKAQVQALITPETGSIFHLAAVVSAQAEADLDIGLAVNLDGTRHVLDASRALKKPPRVIFASSAAVYGGEPPLFVTDATPAEPRTSYGTQKLCGEWLVRDYSRRSLVDGRSLRLPTIVVRPGRPNKAASTFASSIVREPLAGQAAVCPVRAETRMAVLSPRRLVSHILAVHDLDASQLGLDRTVILPGISVSMEEMVEALRRAGGDEAAERIRWEPDPLIQRIVDGWPASMDSARAAGFGLEADASIDDIIKAFVEDDLPAQRLLAHSS